MRDDLALMLVLAFDRALDCTAIEMEIEGYRSIVEWSRGKPQIVTRIHTDGKE